MSIKKVELSKNKIRWEVCIRLPSSRKKIRRRFLKKIEAVEFIDSLKAREKEVFNSSGSVGDIEGTTFNKEADYWLSKKQSEFTKGYFRVINPALKRIRKMYGTYKLSKFSPGLLFEFRLQLKNEGLSESTQNRYTDLITRIINFSFHQRRINHNPCIGYEKVRENSYSVEFWLEDEVKSFLMFISNKYPRGSDKRWIYCVYLLALETGMRAREIWGLKVSDLPKKDTKLKVSRQSLGTEGFGVTKGKSFRYVPISHKLKEELSSLPKNSKKKPKTDLLFSTARGTAIDHDNFHKRIFKKDTKESEVRPIRFHDLRHTAISLMVKRNIVLPIIQQIAGHKSIKTTMRYIHLVAEDIDQVGASTNLAV